MNKKMLLSLLALGATTLFTNAASDITTEMGNWTETFTTCIGEITHTPERIIFEKSQRPLPYEVASSWRRSRAEFVQALVNTRIYLNPDLMHLSPEEMHHIAVGLLKAPHLKNVQRIYTLILESARLGHDAAKKDIPKAQHIFAMELCKAPCLKNAELALELAKKSAAAGFDAAQKSLPHTQYLLAMELSKSHDTKPLDRAYQLMSSAALAGHDVAKVELPRVQYGLAAALCQSPTVRTLENAYDLMFKSAAAGYEKSQRNLPLLLSHFPAALERTPDLDDFERTYRFFAKPIAAGVAHTARCLANIEYQYAMELTKSRGMCELYLLENLRRALPLISNAAHAGVAAAKRDLPKVQAALGRELLKIKDPLFIAQGYKLIMLASQSGLKAVNSLVPQAQYAMAIMQVTCAWIKGDIGFAYKLMKKSAAAGFGAAIKTLPQIQIQFAWALITAGCSQNIFRIMKLLDRAAESKPYKQMVSNIQYELGLSYFNTGRPEDMGFAVSLLKSAESLGHMAAAHQLHEINLGLD